MTMRRDAARAATKQFIYTMAITAAMMLAILGLFELARHYGGWVFGIVAIIMGSSALWWTYYREAKRTWPS